MKSNKVPMGRMKQYIQEMTSVATASLALAQPEMDKDDVIRVVTDAVGRVLSQSAETFDCREQFTDIGLVSAWVTLLRECADISAGKEQYASGVGQMRVVCFEIVSQAFAASRALGGKGHPAKADEVERIAARIDEELDKIFDVEGGDDLEKASEILQRTLKRSNEIIEEAKFSRRTKYESDDDEPEPDPKPEVRTFCKPKPFSTELEGDDAAEDRLRKFAVDKLEMVSEALTIGRFHKSKECPDDAEMKQLNDRARLETMKAVADGLAKAGDDQSFSAKVSSIAEVVHEKCLELIREGKPK